MNCIRLRSETYLIIEQEAYKRGIKRMDLLKEIVDEWYSKEQEKEEENELRQRIS